MHARLLLGLGSVVATLLVAQGQGPAVDPGEFDSPASAYFELQRELGEWRELHGAAWRAEYEPSTGFAHFLWGGSAPAAFLPRGEADFATLARTALAATRDLHGVQPATLQLDGVSFLPLSFAGSSDKWSVRFTQSLGGVQVDAASVNVLFDGMGHDLPEPLFDAIVDELATTFAQFAQAR